MDRAEQCIEDIKNAYMGLKEENGYRNTVKTTLRSFLDDESLARALTPVLMVGRDFGSGAEWGVEEDRSYRVDLPILVIGYIRAAAINRETQKMATVGEIFLADALRLAMADPTFGSSVIAESIITDSHTDGDWDEDGVGIVIRLRVIYYTDQASP